MAWDKRVFISRRAGRACFARVSASGSNASKTPQNFYGTPVAITGGRPRLSSDYPRAGFTPIALSGSAAYTGAPPSGLRYDGTVLIGVCLYSGGSRLTLSGGLDYLGLGSSNQYSRFLPYGYYGGRYNAAMDGTGLVRGDAVYVYGTGTPDQIGLMVRVTGGTFAADGRVMLIW